MPPSVVNLSVLPSHKVLRDLLTELGEKLAPVHSHDWVRQVAFLASDKSTILHELARTAWQDLPDLNTTWSWRLRRVLPANFALSADLSPQEIIDRVPVPNLSGTVRSPLLNTSHFLYHFDEIYEIAARRCKHHLAVPPVIVHVDDWSVKVTGENTSHLIRYLSSDRTPNALRAFGTTQRGRLLTDLAQLLINCSNQPQVALTQLRVLEGTQRDFCDQNVVLLCTGWPEGPTIWYVRFPELFERLKEMHRWLDWCQSGGAKFRR